MNAWPPENDLHQAARLARLHGYPTAGRVDYARTFAAGYRAGAESARAEICRTEGHREIEDTALGSTQLTYRCARCECTWTKYREATEA